MNILDCNCIDNCDKSSDRHRHVLTSNAVNIDGDTATVSVTLQCEYWDDTLSPAHCIVTVTLHDGHAAFTRVGAYGRESLPTGDVIEAHDCIDDKIGAAVKSHVYDALDWLNLMPDEMKIRARKGKGDTIVLNIVDRY